VTSIPKRRRRIGARVQVRLTAAEKTELTAAAHRAGYAHLARYLIDLHRGRIAAVAPLDADQVRAVVRAEIEAVAERQVADLAALAAQVDRLREQVKTNYGAMAEQLKTLASRGSPGATVRPAGSGSTAQPSGI
jgi:hypothetical protein